VTASLNGLVPEMQKAARELDAGVHASGLQGRFTSTLRTYAEQKRLFDRYQRGEAEFPAAPPGTSAHEYGYAFDYVVSPWDYQEDVGAAWESGWEYFEGGTWGGSKDPVHFEDANWKLLAPQIVKPVEPDYGYGPTPWYGQLFSPGPWWGAFVGIPSYADILKKAVKIEKKLGVDAAINWFYRTVGENPDLPK